MLAMICELYQGTHDIEVCTLSVTLLKIILTFHRSFRTSFEKSYGCS
jgi:hypothetical protein